MDILGNDRYTGESLGYNNFTQAQINDLSSQLSQAQNDVNDLQKKYDFVNGNYQKCMSYSWLTRASKCLSNTGRHLSTWREQRSEIKPLLDAAKKTRDELQKSYNSAIEGFNKEQAAGGVSHQTDILGQSELQSKAKSFGIWGAVILGIGFGGFMLYKKIKK